MQLTGCHWLRSKHQKFFQGTSLHLYHWRQCSYCSSSLQVDGRAEYLSPNLSKSNICSKTWIRKNTPKLDFRISVRERLHRCLVHCFPARTTGQNSPKSYCSCPVSYRGKKAFQPQVMCCKSHSSTSSSPSLIVAGDARV